MNSPHPSAWSSVVSGVVSAVVAAVLLSVAAFLFQEPIAERLAQIRPTCDQPAGLVQIPVDQIAAEAPVSDATGAAAAAPENALDGYAGSMWRPPSTHPEGTHVAVFAPKTARLQLTVPDGSEVELVCANNGLASSAFAYKNFGKARTVETWSGDNEASAEVTTLVSQPSAQMQQPRCWRAISTRRTW